MLVPIEPKTVVLPPTVSVPKSLSPLIDAVNAGESLHKPIQAITNAMGFSSFMYGVGIGKTLHRDEMFYFWTTAPREWIAEYDQNSYVEIDPRVTYAWTNLPPPLVWDRHISNGDKRVESFLDRAAMHGIGSGVAFFLHDYSSKVLVALNQPQPILTKKRRSQIREILGDAMQLASIFHFVYVKSVIEKGIPPMHQGSPLSPRECQCLTLAAHGMTSIDIGLKLSITERTVNFHFSNIISKLGVLNRHEAIAMGVAHGLVRVEPRNTPLVPLNPSRVRDAQLKRWEALRAKGAS